MLWSLTNRAISENTALLALLTGAMISAVWPALPFAGDIPSMIPGFFLANLVLFLGSRKQEEGAGTQNA